MPPHPLGSLTCMYEERVHSEKSVILWYDLGRRHWRWLCELCGEEHGTTAIERDHDGPAQTAVRNHIDQAHPEGGIIIEVKDADGDIDDD